MSRTYSIAASNIYGGSITSNRSTTLFTGYSSFTSARIGFSSSGSTYIHYASSMFFTGSSWSRISGLISSEGYNNVVSSISLTISHDSASYATQPARYGPKANSTVSDWSITTASSTEPTYVRNSNSTTFSDLKSFDWPSSGAYCVGHGYANNGSQAFNLNSATLTVVTNENLYTLSYNINGGTGATPASQSDYGMGSSTFTVASNSSTKTGYHFLGWSLSSTATSSSYDAGSSITTGTTTLYAVWSINTSTLSINPNSGSWNGSSSVSTFTQNYNTTLSVPAPTRSGYTFSSWARTNTYGTLSGTTYTFGSTNNVTDYLVASWTANEYTVTLDRQSGSGGTESVNATYDQTMPTITVPSRYGYTFSGYYGSTSGQGDKYYQNDGVGARSWTTASTGTVYAYWVANVHTVTYNGTFNGGSNPSTTTRSVSYNSSVPLTDTCSKTSWTFVGWNTDSSATTALTSYTMPDTNVTLYAIYSRTLVGTFNSGSPSSSVTSSVTIYNNSTSGSITNQSPNTISGKVAEGWRTDSTASAPTILLPSSTPSISISSNTTYYAIYSYTIVLSYDPNGGETSPDQVSGSSYYNSQGSSKNVSFTLAQSISKAGSTFSGWKSSNTGVVYDAGATVTSSVSVVMTAQWDLLEYTIYYDANDPSASGAPASQTKYYDIDITLSSEEPTLTGYLFLGWSTDSTATSPSYYPGDTYSLNSNLSLYAVWSILSYTVTYNYSYNGGSSSTKTSDLVVYNTNADLTPTATKESWIFVGWNTDSSSTTKLDQYTVTNDVTLYAIYSKSITIKFRSGENSSYEDTDTIILYNNQTSGSVVTPSVSLIISKTALGWRSDVSPSIQEYLENETISNISSNIVYYAVYSQSVTLTYNSNGGSPTPQSESGTMYYNSANYYSTVTFTIAGAPDKADYIFYAWKSSVDNHYHGILSDISISESTELSAIYVSFSIVRVCNNGFHLATVYVKDGDSLRNSTI